MPAGCTEAGPVPVVRLAGCRMNHHAPPPASATTNAVTVRIIRGCFECIGNSQTGRSGYTARPKHCEAQRLDCTGSRAPAIINVFYSKYQPASIASHAYLRSTGSIDESSAFAIDGSAKGGVQPIEDAQEEAQRGV